MSQAGLLLIGFMVTSITSLQAEMMPQSETPPSAGGVHHVGRGISAPIATYKTEPQYTEEARTANFQGTVGLSMVVDEEGLPRKVKVVRPLGVGLDEKAIESVQQWRFLPARLNGKPVAVLATVEVNFRLLFGRPCPKCKDHEGQLARLNFTLQPGTARPELTHGKLPGNPAAPGDQFLRIRLQVNEKGKPGSVKVLESTDKDWGEKTLRELRSWRFLPAMANGRPVPVEGVFELAHGREPHSVKKVAPSVDLAPAPVPTPAPAADPK